MSIAVKICGLSTSESVRATAEAGADWIGFNFVDGSPRYIDPSSMAELMPHIGASEAVGLLVDPEDAFVDRVLGTGVRTIQLHGEEPPERVSELARRVPGEVWKAIGVATRDDLKQANEYSSADRLLIDARRNADRLPDLPGNAPCKLR
ncbi:MAG: N-(5'-phosphoribosyl)anthranilate isomerase, partial [Pseudomonadota bacterium]